MPYHDKFYELVEESMASDERTLQKRIGPSSLGNDCWHCLACEIAEIPKEEDPQQIWNQWIGKAAHDRMEQLLKAADPMQKLYIPERRVLVGHVGDMEIWGSADCFDIPKKVVIDWKFPGEKTLNWVKKGNLNPKYKVQPHMYGLGYERLGYEVEMTLVLFMPRDARTVREAFPVYQKYDRTIADRALEHANNLWNLMKRDGVQYVIPRLKRQPGCFDCKRYPL